MENKKPKYPGQRITTNGNQLVSYYTEALISDAGCFYPITPSTEMGENFQLAYAQGKLNAFGKNTIAIETEGEHAAQGGAIAVSVTGKRVVNFTSGQGVVYGIEQYYHAPGKLSTMVLQMGARALTKASLNVHCAHDDFYACLDTGWNMVFAKDAQQASDQAIILRKVNELSLTPGINAQDGFLTTHLERTFFKPEPELIREFLGDPDDIIECPNEPQKKLFGPTRKRVPSIIDLTNPVLIGPVQNQEHYMNAIVSRRDNFSEYTLGYFEQAYAEFAELTGRKYGLISEYKCEDADTIFIAMGSGAENIEPAVDFLRKTYGAKVGVIHPNVIRPFPENAYINALKGKKKVIIIERTDEPLAGDNPLTREIKGALSKGVENSRINADDKLGSMKIEEKPDIVSGVYGLGSRDFRQEHIIAAYNFAWGKTSRQDGKKFGEGASFFYLGVDHPYALVAKTDMVSGLPEGAIAIRMHSIGGWGMITTGKNMSEIFGEISSYVAQRDNRKDEFGNEEEVIHVSANPKYGSEKKGAPTNYFLVAAPSRIRVNCDLKHVDVVLSPDPKIFMHTNAVEGLKPGGVFVWESGEKTSEAAWQRIPKKYRQEIIDKKIQVYILHGFDIAYQATTQPELQLRMQGNSFLGAFFKVSTFLQNFGVPVEEYRSLVRAQYVKKFGRFGEAVVNSNMKVMEDGFNGAIKVEYGDVNAPDTSAFKGKALDFCEPVAPIVNQSKAPYFKMSYFDSEFRAGLGYFQPASVLASTGVMAAATGLTASKFAARREVPEWNPSNCIQCLDCVTVCPDSAMPNMAQDIKTVLEKAIVLYVSEGNDRKVLLEKLPEIESKCRAKMIQVADSKDDNTLFGQIVKEALQGLSVSDKAVSQLDAIFEIFPVAFKKVGTIFKNMEKKTPGAGGIFSINITDHCKGCGACVEICGDREALKMVKENENVRDRNESALKFFKRFSDTPQKYLGLFDASNVRDSKPVSLRNHLMMYSKYNALVAGDGSCAGCGEKSALRVVSTLTETVMRPIFHAKAARLSKKADELQAKGVELLSALKAKDEAGYKLYVKTVLHLLMGFGGADDKDVEKRIAGFKGSDKDIIDAVVAVMRQDAFNHKDLQAIEGTMPNGMCVMAMTAHTGCNSVFSSTPPNNPHPYPWMNSLFQDGGTIGWLIAESFMQTHSRRSVVPERLANALLEGCNYNQECYFKLTHFSDVFMTDLEVMEMPKVWAIGGDGGIGDIGYQNTSKAIVQNRPNIKILMLDTQVYSNTGGQNSDSSVMPGGFDMNQYGAATEGKLTEKKGIAETFMSGHGSPYLALSSVANVSNYYKAIVDGLYYRGIAFIQAYAPCQPEHGVADNRTYFAAKNARDSRSMPEFIYDPRLGETLQEILSIKGNPNAEKDWYQKTIPGTKEKYEYTVAHFAFSEPRFRNHFKVAKKGADEVKGMIPLNKMLQLITNDDFMHRRFLNKEHRSFIPQNGVYTIEYKEDGTPVYYIMSRQLVLFCVERRKSWRMMQSRVNQENLDYKAQKELLAKIDKGELTREAFLNA